MDEVTVKTVSTARESQIGWTLVTLGSMITAGLIQQVSGRESNGLLIGTVIGAGLGIWQLGPGVLRSLMHHKNHAKN